MNFHSFALLAFVAWFSQTSLAEECNYVWIGSEIHPISDETARFCTTLHGTFASDITFALTCEEGKPIRTYAYFQSVLHTSTSHYTHL